MSEEEFERLYDEIDDVSFEELVAVAVTTAMRAGEIASLECCDIDFDGRRIELRNKSFHLVKGGKERSIPMSDIVCEILKSRAVHQGRVFLNAKGRPYSVKALSDRFRRYRRKAGLPEGIRFHTLRHTAITWMHQNGVPSEFIRQIAGHSSILTTHLYTHASPGHLLAASNTLSDWVKSVIQLNKNEPRIGFSV